jgi:hypothetical protein
LRAFSITEAREAIRAQKLPDRALKVVVGSLAAAAEVEAILAAAVAVGPAAVSGAAVASVAVARWSSSWQQHAKHR